MALKYKFNLKDISVQDFKVYFLGMFKSILPKKKIKNLSDLESFIQKKSAWISQVTLYSYLKTRMGTKYVLHFDNEKLLSSINKAKWNIYSVALQDLTFFSFSYLNAIYNYEDIIKSKDIFRSILDNEKKNGMPEEVYDSAKISFDERFQEVDWKKHYNSLPFNDSALALYKWAPIADELKTLDRKIVLNSMILKWDNIKDEFTKLINI
ncbi:MAG: esterase [Candidatus Pelagibacter sp.]